MNQNKPLDDTMLAYLDAAASSSSRGRKILALIVGTVILTFVAHWNSLPHGWINRRVAFQERAFHLITDTIPKATSDTIQRIENAIPTPKDLEDQAILSYLSQERMLHDSKHVEHKLEVLRESQIQATRIIHVPVLGFVFDINDLSLVAGLAFITLLFWFMFSMVNENKDLKLYFAKADKEGCFIAAFELLSMRQVLTYIPSKPSDTNRMVGWGVNVLVVGLMSLPLMLHYTILQHDKSTVHIGNYFNEQLTRDELGMSYALFGLIGALTLTSIAVSVNLGQEWARASERYGELTKAGSSS